MPNITSEDQLQSLLAYLESERPDILAQYYNLFQNPSSVLWPSPSSYKGRHFAVFSSSLVEKFVIPTTPQYCCPKCERGWSPVLEINRQDRDDDGRTHSLSDQRMGKNPVPERGWQTETNVTEYRPTCECSIFHQFENGRCKICGDTDNGKKYCHVPGRVFDPFVGSGTTLLVTRDLGLSGVGADISHKYLDKEASQRLSKKIEANMNKDIEKAANLALFGGMDEP